MKVQKKFESGILRILFTPNQEVADSQNNHQRKKQIGRQQEIVVSFQSASLKIQHYCGKHGSEKYGN